LHCKEQILAIEIRQITEDELEQAAFIAAYSFNSAERHNLASRVERERRYFSMGQTLAAYDDGEMTAYVRVVPLAMRINGRGLSFGGVGPVVSLPQHRRKGHVGALLRRALVEMRERGQVWSGLHTPHPTLYRRYGWEIASIRRVYRFPPKDISLMAQPGERGRARLLKPDGWQQADRVYRRHSATRNGPLHRVELWWRDVVFQQVSQPQPADVALWEDGAGEPQGYVVYQQPPGRDDEPGSMPVRELVALTTDAYLNLILFLLRHDLKREIALSTPPDDPFLSVIEDPMKVTVTDEWDVMLRICDVEAALRQRPPADRERSAAFTLQVSDGSAPWNDGTWRIELAGGETSVERTDAEAGLSISAATLGPVFNGFLSPRAAVFAGLARAASDEALEAAETFFATTHQPFCADGF
jgi:predicted acetyltransferase